MIEYKGYNYKQEEEGTYTIYNEDGKKWIVEIPSEEKAKAIIYDIVKSAEEQATIETLQEQITDLQLALAELVEGGAL